MVDTIDWFSTLLCAYDTTFAYLFNDAKRGKIVEVEA